MSKIRQKIDPLDPYLPSHVGVFEDEIEVSGVMRRVIMYIPEGARASNAGIMILPDDGISAAEMLEKSNWREIADTEEEKKKITLMFLEPRHGHWNIKEPYGEDGGDVEYVKMAYDRFARRDLFCVHESKFYMAGYGSGATIAQMAAMYDPAVYAGIAAVSPKPVPEQFMKEAGAQVCFRLNGFEDDTGLGMKKGKFQFPCGSFWTGTVMIHMIVKQRIGKGRLQLTNAVCFIRIRYSISGQKETLSPLNQHKEAYRLWVSRIENPAKDHGNLLNRRIWKKFLYPVRRWMSQPGGDLRMTCALIDDLHMEYYYREVDGWMREWYVYVPESVKANPDRKVPLVLAMHGYTCSGEIYSGNSGWHQVADEYGFIVVFPSAVHGCFAVKEENRAISKDITVLPAWNIYSNPEFPDELIFFEYLLDDLMHTYCIDEGRVYATGHSMGSLMVQMLAIARPHWFAAVAPLLRRVVFRCAGSFSDAGLFQGTAGR